MECVSCTSSVINNNSVGQKVKPHRIKDCSIRIDTEQFVWLRYRMQVRIFPIQKVRVWFPYFLQHFDVNGHFGDTGKA